MIKKITGIILLFLAFCLNISAQTPLDDAIKTIENFVKEKSIEEYNILNLKTGISSIELMTKTIEVPDNTFAFLIDEEPSTEALCHKYEIVFVSKDEGTISKVIGTKEPFRNADNWNIITSIKSQLRSGNDDQLIINYNYFNKTNRVANNCYAIVVNGGFDIYNNHTRYWNNCSAVYQALVNVFGYDKSKITTLISDGTSTNNDMNLNNGQYGDSPKDLDGDGLCDINYSATKSNLSVAFNNLRNVITSNDEVFIYVTDHGYSCENPSICLWNNQLLSPAEFATEINKISNAKSVKIVLVQCFGGAHIIPSQGPNRTIITASKADQTAVSTSNYSMFGTEWLAGITGKDIITQNTVNADLDNDGEVSLEESFIYGKNSYINKYSTSNYNDHTPQYWSANTFTGEYQLMHKTLGCKNGYDAPKDVAVTNNISSQNKTVWSGYDLRATNEISNSSNVAYNAYNKISLKSGFNCKNSQFTARIISCSDTTNKNYSEMTVLQPSMNGLGNGCGDNIDNDLFDDYYTQVPDIKSSKSIIIFPNPTTGAFTIKFGSEAESGNEVEIADITGKIVYRNANLGQQANIDLSGNASGVYFIRAIAGDQVYTKQIVLK